MVKQVEPIPAAQRRAMKIWQVLIARATNEQVIRYDELAKLIGREVPARGLGQYLDRVSAFCERREKPDITVLVINISRKRPGKLPQGLDLDRERLRVFQTPWFAMDPPRPEEFYGAE